MAQISMSNAFIGGEQIKGQEVRDIHEKKITEIANSISTSFGPLGLDKMCIDGMGEVLITNDGATILSCMDVSDPASKMIVDLAKQQDEDVGDGTTSVVLLAASLIEKGNQIIKKGVHPSIVVSGYKMAFKESHKFLKSSLQVESAKLTQQVLKSIVETSISSKVIKTQNDHFCKIIVDSMKAIENEKNIYDLKNISILKKQGLAMNESFLVNGFALNCSLASHLMVKKLKNPKIACLNFSLKKTKMPLGVNIVVSDPAALEAIRLKEIDITRIKVSKIINSGANLILTTGSIDDICVKQFIEANAMAVRRVKEEDLIVIAKAVGTSVINSLSDLEGDDNITNLGFADSVVLENVGDRELLFINGMKKKMASIVLRGANEQLLDEMERSVHDALCALKRALESKAVVPGGGSVETALSLHLDHFANTICSKDQVGIHKFAEALLVIPKTLVTNAGLDSNELVAKLLSHQNKDKNNEGYRLGIDVMSGSIQDNIKHGIIEPAMSKLKFLRSATEAAISLLRIDEIIKLVSEVK